MYYIFYCHACSEYQKQGIQLICGHAIKPVAMACSAAMCAAGGARPAPPELLSHPQDKHVVIFTSPKVRIFHLCAIFLLTLWYAKLEYCKQIAPKFIFFNILHIIVIIPQRWSMLYKAF